MVAPYDEMQGVATELLSEFAQRHGHAQVETPDTPGSDEPRVPVLPTVASYPLGVTVRCRHRRFENRVLIGEVTFAVPAVVPP